MACEPPEVRDVPLSRSSSSERAAQAIAEGLVVSVSASTVRRRLHEDAIPVAAPVVDFPPDPEFASKAVRVLDRHDRTWDGVPLREVELVLSATRSPSSPAALLSRPGLRPRPPPGVVRVPPGGTLSYFSAHDVHRAHLFGRVAPAAGSRQPPGSPRWDSWWRRR